MQHFGVPASYLPANFAEGYHPGSVSGSCTLLKFGKDVVSASRDRQQGYSRTAAVENSPVCTIANERDNTAYPRLDHGLCCLRRIFLTSQHRNIQAADLNAGFAK